MKRCLSCKAISHPTTAGNEWEDECPYCNGKMELIKCARDDCKKKATDDYVYCQKHVDEDLEILSLAGNADDLKRHLEGLRIK